MKFVNDEFDSNISAGGLISGVYQLLTTGLLSTDHSHHPNTRNCHIEPKLNFPLFQLSQSFISVYNLLLFNEPKFTNKTEKFNGCLDYIFISDHFEVINILELPYDNNNEKSVLSFSTIPNQFFPSDHLALGCTIRFRDE